MSYNLCKWLLLLVFCMQFVVSFCANNLWELLGLGSLNQYDYIWLTQIFAILIPCLLLCLYNGSGIKKTFGIKKLKFFKVWNCIGLGVCLQPVAILMNIPLQKFGEANSSPVSPPNSMWDILMMLFFVCVIPAVCEELLLRGMVLTSTKRKGYAFSIIVSTFMFVLLHSDISTSLGHAVLGIAAAFAVLNTGSVFAGMFVHASFNFCGVMIDYITNRFYTQGGFIGTLDFFILLGLLGLVLSVVFFKNVYSNRLKKYCSDNLPMNIVKSIFNIPVMAILTVYILRIVL